MKTTRKLLEYTIQELYSAQIQFLKALPKLIDRTQSDHIRRALQMQWQQTQHQMQQLEQVTQQMGLDLTVETCAAMQGILDDTQRLLARLDDDASVDLAIVGAAQKAKHYEIAVYGTARTLAKQADQQPIANVLEQMLDLEKQTDAMLTSVATSSAKHG